MADDIQGCLTYYAEAYTIFQNINDQLFMLLTAKLIIDFCNPKKNLGVNVQPYEKVIKAIMLTPEFKDVNLDLLFENFEHRLELAQIVN